MPTKIKVVDLFCGAGGLAHGFKKQGIKVAAGIDVDQHCKYPFEINNKAPFIQKDVSKLTGIEVSAFFGDTPIRVLAGCAPCQPFSKYTQGKANKDLKWGLLYEFARLIKETSPEIVTMENVPELTRHGVFSDFLHRLKDLSYHLSYKVVDCRNFGIPQSRRRLVLLASRLGPIELEERELKPSEYTTVRQVLSSLPKIAAGQAYEADPLHRASSLSPTNLKRIRASIPGGTWKEWDKRLVARCHKQEGGSTYQSVYGRMEWDRPSPTITTQCYGFGNGRFGHPEQDRAISLREAAILQSFPPNYKFVNPNSPIHMSIVGRLIGNAVPVSLAQAVARSIIEHVRRNS